MNKEHGFEPVYDKTSRVLILGTLPSVKSTEQGFYYGHPQNRFWRLIAELLGCTKPSSVEEKKNMLLSGGIALWDVIKRCDIEGSSDASIRNAEPNDIMRILSAADIKAIYANGSKAAELYNKLLLPVTGREIITLPSTSPANAAWNFEKLKEAWSIILK
ncbi:MAG: DNA-deoxyinosine glycosylase [Oscillospiraceae bacterium]|nr:DNA-deoxyinosine glycosylase [Oscillospiraceae bacterium]